MKKFLGFIFLKICNFCSAAQKSRREVKRAASFWAGWKVDCWTKWKASFWAGWKVRRAKRCAAFDLQNYLSIEKKCRKFLSFILLKYRSSKPITERLARIFIFYFNQKFRKFFDFLKLFLKTINGDFAYENYLKNHHKFCQKKTKQKRISTAKTTRKMARGKSLLLGLHQSW